jgi:hypothetical protein
MAEDILGIKPISNAVEKVTDATIKGSSAFLSRICLPAAEEFGFLLQDKVKSWRASNAVKLAQKAEQLVEKYHGMNAVTVHPRIAHSIFEEGSWSEDDIIHTMWAGLLASGCNETGNDDSNIVFIAILKQLTVLQVILLRNAIENTSKYVSKGGWPYAENITYSIEELINICQTEDIARIDRELDHLRSLELIGNGLGEGGGFSPDNDNIANMQPTGLALHLYVRGEGFVGSPIDYWDLKERNRNTPSS